MSNPAQDIAFPQMPNMDQTFSLNMLGLINQWAEKQAVMGSCNLDESQLVKHLHSAQPVVCKRSCSRGMPSRTDPATVLSRTGSGI